jgi:hypothetical protein
MSVKTDILVNAEPSRVPEIQSLITNLKRHEGTKTSLCFSIANLTVELEFLAEEADGHSRQLLLNSGGCRWPGNQFRRLTNTSYPEHQLRDIARIYPRERHHGPGFASPCEPVAPRPLDCVVSHRRHPQNEGNDGDYS